MPVLFHGAYRFQARVSTITLNLNPAIGKAVAANVFVKLTLIFAKSLFHCFMQSLQRLSIG